jgi:hypothetical protein
LVIPIIPSNGNGNGNGHHAPAPDNRRMTLKHSPSDRNGAMKSFRNDRPSRLTAADESSDFIDQT